MKLLLSFALAATLSLNIIGNQKTYSATAYCLKGKMANGQTPHRGAVAANSLALGTKIHLEAGKYTGTYVVKDRGVHGNRVDIWMPTKHEAVMFGRRTVKLTVLSK